MGTEYQIVNISKRIFCGFGLDWNPKYAEAQLNKECARFLLFIMLEKYREDEIKVLHEGNSWDWTTELVTNDLTQWVDKSEELLKDFKQWENNTK